MAYYFVFLNVLFARQPKDNVKMPAKSDIWLKIVGLERPKPIRSGYWIFHQTRSDSFKGSEGHASSATMQNRTNT